jgi:large subunit ribosomal protein L23
MELKEKENKYVFAVAKDATKGQIKEAIQSLFKVEVGSVHTSIVPGKLKRMGAHSGFRADWKKAIVKIKNGQEIKIAEEA